MKDKITPYRSAGKEQKDTLEKMAEKMEETGYSPHEGWIRNDKQYEIYSKEIEMGSYGKSACRVTLNEKGEGYIVSGEQMEQIIYNKENGKIEIIWKAGAAPDKTKPKKQK